MTTIMSKSTETLSNTNSLLVAGNSNNGHVAKVEGYAEITVEPDVVEFFLRVESIKDKVEEAKTSVSKRIDYLLLTLRNAKIKADRNVCVHHVLTKVDDQFRYVGEILARCESVQKYEDIVNIIVEKLDGSIIVSEPQFSHSPKYLQDTRQRTLHMAVTNARFKAAEMASASYQRLGRALVVEERECQISEATVPSGAFSDAVSLRSRRHARIVRSRVWVIFELIVNARKSNTPLNKGGGGENAVQINNGS